MTKNRKAKKKFRQELFENFDLFLEEVIKERSKKDLPSREVLFAVGAATGVAIISKFIPALMPAGIVAAPLMLTWPLLKKIFDDLPIEKKEKKIAEIEHYRYLHNQFKLAMKSDPAGAKREMKILFDEMVKNLK